MPALAQKSARSSNGTGTRQSGASSAGSGIWSNNREELSLEKLDKFWNELPPHERQKLLRIEKQTFFEHARKNMYCSRCNGLLLEVFSQIVLYGKSKLRESGGGHVCHKPDIFTNELETESVDVWDPSVHSWGGLIATRDGTLTVMDCYLYAKCLSSLQNVFDNARAREHERELLYPDACGGGGRGWMSHGMTNNGRVHGTRETCALHTARLSCDTLVDFWSALSDETQLSLLRMKEEDFIERLMYRFDCKRFCRDCRRNVIREFKELKEMKRMRWETHCTHWFCVADTAFQYEVSDDMVQADWRQSFTETVGTYHHFEWAIGSGEGKSDILDFEDVGMAGEVQVDGLDLCELDACFITLRAWRLDGHCTELTVKARALKGQPCVHRRLVVGDGFVTITKGENIRMFFEHAEEAEEEDDDAMDKNGNDLDSDGSRPQKHARSPELARQFLLDAATVIFKEQVEKAFREGTARQNAHNTFICLALKLLEERVHVACRDIITLEKQIKLLEEEEKEKREELERRERRRTKEREKKLRRKERLKEKEQGKKKKDNQCDIFLTAVETPPSVSSIYTHEKAFNKLGFEDPSRGELVGPCSTDIANKNSNSSVSSKIHDLENDDFHRSHYIDEVSNCSKEGNGSFIQEQSKSTKRKLKLKQDSIFGKASKQSGKPRSQFESDSQLHHDALRFCSRIDRHSRANTQRLFPRSCVKNVDKFHTSKNRIHDGYKCNSCDCNHHADFGEKDVYHVHLARPGWETRTSVGQSTLNSYRQLYSSKHNHGCHATDGPVILKGKPGTVGSSHLGRTVHHMKKVWEPIDSRKKCIKDGSDNELPSRSLQDDSSQTVGCDTTIKGCQQTDDAQVSNCHHLSSDSNDLGDAVHSCCNDCIGISDTAANIVCSDDLGAGETPCYHSKDADEYKTDARSVSFTFASNKRNDTLMCSSSSDNCSSCLSEADSSSSSSSAGNAESSSTSDSEDASLQSLGREISSCNGNNHHLSQDCGTDDRNKIDAVVSILNGTAAGVPVASCAGVNSNPIQSASHTSDASRLGYDTVSRQQQMLPMQTSSFHVPYYSAPTMAYQSHAQTSFFAIPTNGIISFSQPHQYVFPDPVRYGLAANRPSDFSIRYSGMHPLMTTIPSANQPSSTCHGVNKADIMKFDMQTRNSKMNGNPQGNGSGDPTRINSAIEGSAPSRQPSSKSMDKERAGTDCAGQSYKTSFSLFHSGGPVASGLSLDPLSWKNKTIPEIQTKGATEETTVEEYSLFASSGSRFSFF